MRAGDDDSHYARSSRLNDPQYSPGAPMKKKWRGRGKTPFPDVYITQGKFTPKVHISRTKERGPDELFSLYASAFPEVPRGAQFILWLLDLCVQKLGHNGARLVFRDCLITCHLSIVEKIARRIIRKRFDHRVRELLPEFIAEGNLGLVEAWNTFNPLNGMFSTHANFWIKKRMFEYLGLISSTVDRPRGVESKLDLPLSTPIPGSDGHDTLEGALTLGEIIRGEWQAEDAAQERFEDFELERAYRVARIILNREELHIFLCRYRSPPKKLRELSEELGLPIKRIWKIAQRALRKVVERMRHEDET